MRYILGILIGLGLIVLVFLLILRGFSGGSTAPKSKVNLLSYVDTNAVSQLVIDAPIISDSQHRTIKISISATQNELDVIQGYQGTVIQSQVFPNNPSAYAVFLHALDKLNFTKGNSDPALSDERGYCPQGDRYIYSLVNNATTVMRYWSTSCGSSQGTFGGATLNIRALFENQIPDTSFNTLTSGISFTR